ncbi:MAG: peptide chain release factor N(5)-glutamine methyltransferase [Phycisphaerae bacterium]|nr:peptide chain release factor N(5)-glutamine methyltransferase [Phycisphaerae bacterium]
MNRPSDSAWTVLKLLNWTRDYLTGAVDEPRLSAEVLLASVLKCPRLQLYTRFDYPPTPGELAAFHQLVRRAHAHEPVAYLVGEKEFYSLRFKVTPDVLVPRAETEALVSEAVSHLRAHGGATTMWDVCTGSGCVAIATACHAPQTSVLGTDISPAAVAIATANAVAHGLGDRVRFRVADLLTLPEDCRAMAPFGVIAGNPPYVAEHQMISETVRHEPPAAIHGGADGLDFLRRLIADAPPMLSPGGAMILEFGFTQADAVSDLLAATGAFEPPRVLCDHQGIERSLVAVRRS